MPVTQVTITQRIDRGSPKVSDYRKLLEDSTIPDDAQIRVAYDGQREGNGSTISITWNR